jgi:hypothetical protein
MHGDLGELAVEGFRGGRCIDVDATAALEKLSVKAPAMIVGTPCNCL